VKAEQPDLTFGELGKALGQKWGELEGDDKSEWQVLAKKDKERHVREKAEYDAKKLVSAEKE
jgi:hypothetical protein